MVRGTAFKQEQAFYNVPVRHIKQAAAVNDRIFVYQETCFLICFISDTISFSDKSPKSCSRSSV